MFELVSNVYAIALNIIGVTMCMFIYVEDPRRDYEYAITHLLCSLLSNYYWGCYTVLMGEDPTVSSFMAYFGWNVGYLPLIFMLLHRQTKEEKKFFSFWSLIPIPINIAQFVLYMQFGGLFNNLWEGIFSTWIAILAINTIMYGIKNRKNGVKVSQEAIYALAYITIEYVMWTSTCFDWPGLWSHPYTYASLIMGFLPVLFPIMIAREYGGIRHRTNKDDALSHLSRFIRPFYVALVLVTCGGGYLLAAWMKNTLEAGLMSDGDSNPFTVIAVMLFVFSLVLVMFSMTLIMMVQFARKASESDELRKAKAIADHSNAAKSDFLANMSHEIRTPINAILGMNEMILRESLLSRDSVPKERGIIQKSFSDICNYAGNIESAGSNLLSIINDILDISKIEAGKMEIMEGNYRLSSVLNDLCNMIAYKARDKGLTFDIDVDPTLPEDLFGDEVRIRQVLTNILNNAIKYTRQGSVHMSVQGKKEEDRKDAETVCLIVKVKDTGIGIREEDIGKLFTKFERMDLKTNSTVEGTGLGLAITKNLMTMMGGTIEVRSTYGEGSEFTVTLPQKVLSAESLGDFKTKFEKSMLERQAYTESFRAPDVRILVVDDTIMNLTVVKGLLKSTQIVIDTATSGRTSIQMARETAYDLILMDQRMPEMDGTEAMTQIKADPQSKNRDTAFICLTADALSGARERYMAVGFTDYLTKPIDSMALESMLAHYLPKEKLLPVPKADAEDGKAEGESDSLNESETFAGEEFAILQNAGFDIGVGLMHCQKDPAFYQTILKEYVDGAKEKRSGLDTFYREQNWPEYSVLAHSLKSTSKMIGVHDLYEIAARLEVASDEKNAEAVQKDHTQMMKRYSDVLDAIRSQLHIPEDTGKIKDTDSDKDSGAEEMEVLEFLPEQND